MDPTLFGSLDEKLNIVHIPLFFNNIRGCSIRRLGYKESPTVYTNDNTAPNSFRLRLSICSTVSTSQRSEFLALPFFDSTLTILFIVHIYVDMGTFFKLFY
jgi:hypothetical protein